MKEIILFYPRPWPGQTMSGRLPYSLLIIVAYLQNFGLKVRIIDERTVDNLRFTIGSLDPNAILLFGISSFTGIQIRNGVNIATLLKHHYPQIPIVWGGWHPTALPDQTLKHPLVDIIVRGQGEVTLKHLALALENGKDLTSIEGISYKTNDTIIHNPDRDLSYDMTKLSMPFEAVDVEKYIYVKPFADNSSRTLGIITSLGCPNNCGFCQVAGVYKRRTLFRNMEHILNEIDFLVKKYHVNSFTIDDDNFFVSHKRVRQFCEALIDRHYSISWDAGVSVNILLKNYDDDFLKLIKASGCKQLYIGAESGSDAVLEMINKNASVSQTYEFVEKMKKVGIRASISSMVGLPNTPDTEMVDTMNMILKCRDLNPDFDFRIFYYTPYPSTFLYTEALKAGMKEPDSLEQWSEHTLRRFKAPWVKKTNRNQIKYFYYYYYPYSGSIEKNRSAKQPIDKLIEWIDSTLFENALFRALARLRVKHRFYKFPLDAFFAIQGKRLKSLYGRLVHKNIDAFYEFDH